jgi:Pyruvate/2-oxoacid:ferredoxin oxidoreductase delta subunit
MSPYKNLIIYYFSGTGNALISSRWIIEKAKSLGINTWIIPIDRMKKIEIPEVEGKTLIGISGPTHGFNLPWILLKFIFRFPSRKGTELFLLNTRAGIKIGKFFFRGLSGIAMHLPILILYLKGYKIRGLFPVDLPSNWISLHAGLSDKKVISIAERRKGEVDKLANKILEGKKAYAYWYFYSIPFDLIVAPITFAYFFYGRFFLAKTFIASSDCNDCRLCEQRCPTESIVIRDNRPYWRLTCESCMRCINICPKKSIQCSHSLVAFLIFVSTSIPIYICFENWLTKILPEQIVFLEPLVAFPILWPIKISVIFLCYFLIFWMMKSKIVNDFFTYTSLTKYWRRYRAPGISATDFKVQK